MGRLPHDGTQPTTEEAFSSEPVRLITTVGFRYLEMDASLGENTLPRDESAVLEIASRESGRPCFKID